MIRRARLASLRFASSLSLDRLCRLVAPSLHLLFHCSFRRFFAFFFFFLLCYCFAPLLGLYCCPLFRPLSFIFVFRHSPQNHSSSTLGSRQSRIFCTRPPNPILIRALAPLPYHFTLAVISCRRSHRCISPTLAPTLPWCSLCSARLPLSLSLSARPCTLACFVRLALDCVGARYHLDPVPPIVASLVSAAVPVFFGPLLLLSFLPSFPYHRHRPVHRSSTTTDNHQTKESKALPR